MFSSFKLSFLVRPRICRYVFGVLDLHTSRDTAKCALFVNPTVQELLLSMTKNLPERTLPDIVTRKRNRVITLMTNEELTQAQSKAAEKTLEALQMPPVLPERLDKESILSHDEIEGFSDCKYVFVDTTLGLHERERSMVVREMNGTLRQANWEERDRLSQIYYPRNGRRLTPAHLHNALLREKLLEERSYKYILDVACAQFEPDDRCYIEICEDVYKHIEQRGTYDILLGTRHYGSMIFTLLLHNTIHNFTIYLLEHQRLDDTLRLAQLWHIVNNLPIPENSMSSPAGKTKLIEALVEKIPRTHRLRVDSLLSTLAQQSSSSDSESSDGDTSDGSSSSDSDDNNMGTAQQTSSS